MDLSFGVLRGLFVASLPIAACVAACGGPMNEPPKAPLAPHASSGPKVPGPMGGVKPTRMGARLAEIGLDVRHLPPIERLTPEQRRTVMTTFSDSLGIPCTGCHNEGAFRADTRRKRVAKRMYNEIARLLVLENGEAVYCDGCHQGKEFSIDRSDKAKLADYMTDQYVDKLRRSDGQEHDCGTCHGDPPEFSFIARWKESPAPNLVLASEKQIALEKARMESLASAPPVASADHDAGVNAARTFPPAKKPPKPYRVCGEKDNLCPMQVWMRKNVAPAVTANDTQALATAMDKLATLSPDPSWEWADIARKSAEAARRGDMDEARKACRTCHSTLKPQWRQKFRGRPIR